MDIPKPDSFPDFEMPPCACPLCGKLQEMAAAINREAKAPTEHDISVCIGCGGISIFTADRMLRAATESDLRRLRNDRESWAKILFIQREIRLRQ